MLNMRTPITGIASVVILAFTVLMLSAVPAQAQTEPVIPDLCNDTTFFAAQQAYLDSLSSTAPAGAQAVESARQTFAQRIADCYAQIDVDQLQYDEGGLFPPTSPAPRPDEQPFEFADPDFVTVGTKWGGVAPFLPPEAAPRSRAVPSIGVTCPLGSALLLKVPGSRSPPSAVYPPTKPAS